MDFFAVTTGKKPGIYFTWAECKKQTGGKEKFEVFSTRSEAVEFFEEFKHERKRKRKTVKKASKEIHTRSVNLNYQIVKGCLPDIMNRLERETFPIKQSPEKINTTENADKKNEIIPKIEISEDNFAGPILEPKKEMKICEGPLLIRENKCHTKSTADILVETARRTVEKNLTSEEIKEHQQNMIDYLDDYLILREKKEKFGNCQPKCLIPTRDSGKSIIPKS